MKVGKVALVTATPVSGEEGGAERLYRGLFSAIRNFGIDAERIDEISDERGFASVEESYLRFYDLDLSKFDAVISTKAPSYLVRHPNHICYLVHTMRVFYDMFDVEYPRPNSEQCRQQRLIHSLDTAALSPPRTKRVFTIGQEVSDRLRELNGINGSVIHPGLEHERFRPGTIGDYLFLPGRLHRWKRVDLVIKAFQYVRKPVRFLIAGTGEDEQLFRHLAGEDDRIEFLGHVSENELLRLYSNCLAVPFVPTREDFGYVTIEAFRSAKPVITCRDSGEPTHLVKDGVSGWVVEPDPKKIADIVERLYENRDEAIQMGEQGRASVADLTWERSVDRLLKELQMDASH